MKVFVIVDHGEYYDECSVVLGVMSSWDKASEEVKSLQKEYPGTFFSIVVKELDE